MNSAHRIASPSGISIELNANGSIRRMDHGDIMLNLFLGNEVDGGLANVHLRRLQDRLARTWVDIDLSTAVRVGADSVLGEARGILH